MLQTHEIFMTCFILALFCHSFVIRSPALSCPLSKYHEAGGLCIFTEIYCYCVNCYLDNMNNHLFANVSFSSDGTNSFISIILLLKHKPSILNQLCTFAGHPLCFVVLHSTVLKKKKTSIVQTVMMIPEMHRNVRQEKCNSHVTIWLKI